MMVLYLEITKDKYELPLAVAETVEELAKMRGTTRNVIASTMSHYKADKRTFCKYIKVEIDD